jgi:repressor LexA
MKLSKILNDFRTSPSRKWSMDTMAEKSGLSKAYIAIIENEKNPISGKPSTPSYETLQKLAKAMSLTTDQLVSMMDDDTLVSVNADDSVTPFPMDNFKFDDYFPLHYCTNLSAGSFDELIDAEPDAVVYVPIKFQGRRKKLLAFQVNGTSMNNVIEDGSIVVVENTSNDGINYKDGTIIVAYCDGLVTVKRLYRQSDGNVTLAPDSSDKTHLPIMINTTEQQLVIIGKVLWHMNPDDIAEKKY